jgi:hydrogenase-4 component E
MSGFLDTYARLTLTEQAILTLAAMVLVSSFALLAQSRVVATIRLFALQGFLLVVITALVALNTQEYHLFYSAGLTLLLKVWFVPWLLTRQARRLGILRDLDSLLRPGVVLIAAGALVIFCYSVALPIQRFAESITRDAIAISLAVVMLSMLMLITRRKAITQVVGFMSMENGLFFGAVTATQGMPMVVELGVAFDVLIAAVVFGVFFFHIRDSIESLDVDMLNQLTEVDE